MKWFRSKRKEIIGEFNAYLMALQLGIPAYEKDARELIEKHNLSKWMTKALEKAVEICNEKVKVQEELKAYEESVRSGRIEYYYKATLFATEHKLPVDNLRKAMEDAVPMRYNILNSAIHMYLEMEAPTAEEKKALEYLIDKKERFEEAYFEFLPIVYRSANTKPSKDPDLIA